MKKKILLAITPLLLGVIGCSPSGNFHPVGDIGEKISLDEAKSVTTEIIKAQASSDYRVHDSAKIDISLTLTGQSDAINYSEKATGKAYFSNTLGRAAYHLEGTSSANYNDSTTRYLVDESRTFFIGEDDVYYTTNLTDVTPDAENAETMTFKHFTDTDKPILDASYYLVGGGSFNGPQKWLPIGGYPLEEVTSADPNVVNSYEIVGVRFTAYDKWQISDAAGENMWGASIASGSAIGTAMLKLENNDIYVNTAGLYNITFNIHADDTYSINVVPSDIGTPQVATNNNSYWFNAQTALGFPTGKDALTHLNNIQTQIDRNPTNKSYYDYNFYSNGAGSLYITYSWNSIYYAMQFVENDFVYGIVRVRSNNSSLESIREYIISYEDVTADELSVPTIDDTWTNVDNPFDDYPNQEVEEEGGTN